ncbi:tail completion protein gp17, partial [Wolbachia endosymbiont of Nomada ferruginata]
MEKIQAINELYNSIYAALKANSDLRKYVTNIYDYLPKQVTIPYLRLHVVNYNNLHMLSNFATKARFSCDIYTHHIGSMFAIIRHINLILKSIKYSDNETILESNCAMSQHDEILHSTINFDILIKGGDN